MGHGLVVVFEDNMFFLGLQGVLRLWIKSNDTCKQGCNVNDHMSEEVVFGDRFEKCVTMVCCCISTFVVSSICGHMLPCSSSSVD